MTDEASDPTISYVRHDPERRLALPSGRFTQVNHATTLVAAGLLTVAVFWTMLRIPDTTVTVSLTRRGWVPYAIVFLSLWCLLILGMKWLKVRFQRRVLRLRITPDDPTFALSPLTVDGVIDRMYTLVDEPRQFLLFNRILIALSNLKNMMRIGDVDEVLASQADADEAVVESSYTIVRGLLWMVPILGFVGTVLGLSEGIGKFSGVLDSASDVEALKPALREVTSGLSTAFETTLHGLLGALLIHFMMTLVRRTEEIFLDDCREYCQRHVVSKLRLSPTEGMEPQP